MFFMNIITSVELSVPSGVSATVNTVEANTNLVTRDRRIEYRSCGYLAVSLTILASSPRLRDEAAR
jgi:hypothetical protein